MSGTESFDEPADFEVDFKTAREGSTDERAALIESFRVYLKGVAVEMMSHQRVGQLSASDIVQSAIIDANQGFESCKAKSHGEFKAWLRQILLNDIVDRYRFLRSQKRDVRLETPLSERVAVAAGTESPSGEAIIGEDRERLDRAMSHLSEEQREVILLRQRDQMTFVEIAKEMERTPDSARKLWTRAVAALSKHLGPAR